MKFIKILVLHSLLFYVGVLSLKAQNYRAEDVLIQDKKIKKGTLSNGMTYYIYPTAVNKGTASYYIIQNVGSILENDKQKGLAHFLEHMAFNGTKNFKGKEILTTLQVQGAAFGRNINAYTSYDETVYNFNNIPSTDPAVVDNCLLILHDWSNSLLLTDEEIDAERGVIVEEWRTRQDAQTRIYNQFSPYLYNHSLYAERAVIGDMNIIKHFDYPVLKDFYKTWYRPDLQAIAIVGDIDTAEIEKKIKSIFADIKSPQNPSKRFEISIPNHDEAYFKLAVDKEITMSNISFMIVQKDADKSMTFADLQESVLRNIAFSILNDRLNAISQKENSPFKNANASYFNFTRKNDALSIDIAPKPGKQAAAFAAVMDEFIRAGKFGFSDNEIQRAAASTTSFYENYIEVENEMVHQGIIGRIKGDYLSHQLFSDAKAEFEMVKSILKDLDSKTIQTTLTKGYTSTNRVITVTGLENETNLTQEEALSIIAKSENNPDLKPYEDNFSGKSLLTDVTIIPGKIISEKLNKKIEATTFTLSNGVKVHYKFANKNAGDIQLRAKSFGGSSLYESKNLPSVNMAASLAQASGLGSFSNIDLEKILTGKNAASSVSISGLTETVFGNSKVKDLETMMQLVYLRFAKPRFDSETFAIMKSNLQDAVDNKDKDINGKMRDSLNVAIYGKNNPKIRVLDQQYINDLSFDKMKVIYQERFCDVSNFDFYIVGDVTPEILKPLLEKYIASIHGIKRKETFKDNIVLWKSDKIDKDIFIKMETPKSTVRIQFENDIKYNPKNNVLASMLGDILTLRYTESLREKEGGTYGANVSAYITQFPKNTATLIINFDCDASKAEDLIAITYQEIEKIKSGVFVKEDIEKTKTNLLKTREDSKNFNNYGMDLIYNFFQNKIDMNDPATFTDIIKTITEKDIQDFAGLFLTKAKSYEVVFKPLL